MRSPALLVRGRTLAPALWKQLAAFAALSPLPSAFGDRPARHHVPCSTAALHRHPWIAGSKMKVCSPRAKLHSRENRGLRLCSRVMKGFTNRSLYRRSPFTQRSRRWPRHRAGEVALRERVAGRGPRRVSGVATLLA